MSSHAFESTQGGNYEPICDAYDGQCVFITGGAGFLGKVFVEKILYTCPKIAKVYILLRQTDKASVEEKFRRLLDSPIFQKLKQERPWDLEKLIPITGDISKPNLAIKPEDESVLLENVSMVFHFAATVRFNESLSEAIDINVEGTRRILDLCGRMKKIQLFLHVSTAFCHPTRQEVEEVVYPSLVPLNCGDTVPESLTFRHEDLEDKLNAYPNTYTLTKSLAENLVAKFSEVKGIPAVIIRPSIVIACKDEPLSGWLDNWYGPTFLVVMISKGIVRAVSGNSSNIIDMIPVDYVANLAVIAASRCRRSNSIKVFNSCSSDANPITLGKLGDLIIKDSIKNKSYVFPRPIVYFLSRRWLLSILFFLEFICAYLADFVLQIFGKKPKYIAIMSKVDKVRQSLDPFTSRSWKMKTHNTSALFETLSSNERRVFACDASTVDWDEYIPIYFQGIRKYLLGNKHK